MPPKHLRLTVPISFAGLGAIYYGISMLSFAKGNMTTALAVAVNMEFLSALAAMSLRAAPAIFLPVVLYVLYRIRHYQMDEAGDGQIVVILGVLSILVAVLYSSVIVLMVCMLMLVFHLIHLVSHKKNWKRKVEWGWFNPEMARVLVVSIMLTSVIWGPSWLARETVLIAEEHRVISVIKETEDVLYYLDLETNRLVYAKPADLSHRAYCTMGEYDTVASVVQLVMAGSTYPSCPR